MKKLAFLIVCAFIFTACEIDDDGPSIETVYAKVVNAELPDHFEEGEIYEVDVTYLLPDACHNDVGLHVRRASQSGEGYRQIYVFAIASHDPMLTECTRTEEDLEVTRNFTITIDDSAPFTFYLWTGVDENNENVYTQIEVPVVEPEETPDGDGETAAE